MVCLGVCEWCVLECVKCVLECVKCVCVVAVGRGCSRSGPVLITTCVTVGGEYQQNSRAERVCLHVLR